MHKKKWILDIAFLIAVIAATIYGVFHGQNLSRIKTYLTQADVRWWYAGAGIVVLYIVCESCIFYYAMKPLEKSLRVAHCMVYSFIGFFFALITPFGIGGQPAQVVAMKKDDISIAVSVPVLIVVTITFKAVLIAYGLFVLLIRPARLMTLLQPVIGWCWLGLVLNLLFVTFLLLMIFKPFLIERPALVLVRWYAGKKHSKKAAAWGDWVRDGICRYSSVAGYFKTHRSIIYSVFVITFLQRSLLFFVTYLAYRSFGLRSAGVPTVVTLQAMISVAVEMLPLPGGMGITESMFLKIFAPLCAAEKTLPVLIVSRGISYYVQLIISALFTVFAPFAIGRKRGLQHDRVL